MTSFVEVAVNVPQVTGVFHYHLPPHLVEQVQEGYFVEVPFGRQHVQGIILRFVDQPSVAETRAVIGVIDSQAVLSPAQIQLAEHLAAETLSPLADWIGLMLPPGLGRQVETQYALEANLPSSRLQQLGKTQARLVALLAERGSLRNRQLDRLLPHVDWRSAAMALVRKNVITAKSVLPSPGVKARMTRSVTLAVPAEVAEANLAQIGRADSSAKARRQAIIRFLIAEAGPVNVAWVYAQTGGTAPDLRKLAEAGLVRFEQEESLRDPLEGLDYLPSTPPLLTQDQQMCWQVIQAMLQQAAAGQAQHPVLLHGVTGSGKTEVYLHAVEEALRLGRQAIILVPEIALTPQTTHRFLSRFPGQVGLMHSGLSPGERYDTWRRARSGAIQVMVGPRSALFVPFPRLGLIVLDECHDGSYYQAEPPFYDARQVALLYARLVGGLCIFGSATPDIVHTYQASQGGWRYLHLPARILAHRQSVQAQLQQVGGVSHYHSLENQAETIDLPPVRVVDMREELKAGNRSIFSLPLQEALRHVLEQKQQGILFLNRRGTATYVFCRDCGEALKCPHCNLPLTYHTWRPESKQGEPGGANLRCHHCGYRRKMPERCPVCGSARIRQYGTGTEKVEAELQALFPAARSLRWDYETTRQKGAHELILTKFAAHQADILVGTQMLAKGLDLPLVTLVGVVLADVGLSLPDYMAAERVFQVLTQVAGRAGRSPLGGQVLLQTFQPEHYVIQAAAGHDYRRFYQRELEYRRQLGYPPFQQLVRLEYRHPDETKAEQISIKLAEDIKGWIAAEGRRATEIIGPAPCFFTRVADLYRWQIILRGPDPAALLRGHALREWRVEVNPPSLL